MTRPASPFLLTASDFTVLQGWLRMSTLEQRRALRALILILLAKGLPPKAVSQQLQITAPTVFKWRKRYLDRGIEGLGDLPRSGQPPRLSFGKIEKILTLTLQDPPTGAAHWGVRSMAANAQVTTWQIRQIWAASNSTPYRLKALKRQT